MRTGPELEARRPNRSRGKKGSLGADAMVCFDMNEVRSRAWQRLLQGKVGL
jgi:hypothetical protein